MTRIQDYIKTKRNHIVAILVTMVALFMVALNWPWLADNWFLATTHQPERFTSLGFVSTGRMPTYSPAGRPQHITFQLANHEAARTTYHYLAILSSSNGTTQTLGEGNITLDNGASTTRVLTYTMPAANLGAQLIVQLPGRPEYVTLETKS